MRNDEMQMTGGQHAVNLPQVEIRSLRRGEDATAFRTLNEEWITRYFTLEEMDHEVLSDPENNILRKGGKLVMDLPRFSGEGLAQLAAIFSN